MVVARRGGSNRLRHGWFAVGRSSTTGRGRATGDGQTARAVATADSHGADAASRVASSWARTCRTRSSTAPARSATVACGGAARHAWRSWCAAAARIGPASEAGRGITAIGRPPDLHMRSTRSVCTHNHPCCHSAKRCGTPLPNCALDTHVCPCYSRTCITRCTERGETQMQATTEQQMATNTAAHAARRHASGIAPAAPTSAALFILVAGLALLIIGRVADVSVTRVCDGRRAPH